MTSDSATSDSATSDSATSDSATPDSAPGSPTPPTLPVMCHVGYQKTGSTWFQDSVLANVANRSLVDRHALIDHVIDPGRFAFDAEQAREILLGGLEKPPIVSHEWLIGHPFSRGYDTEVIAQRLQAIFGPVSILIIIRNQADMLRAHYGEWIRHGGSLSLSRFVASPPTWRWHPGFRFDYFEYDRAIAFYQDMFGAEAVTVACYEQLRLDPDAFLRTASQAAGTPLEVGPEGSVYRSLQPATLAVNRQLNRLVSTWGHNPGAAVVSPGAHHRMGRTLKRVDAAVPSLASRAVAARMDKQIQEAVQGRYGASNLRTEVMTGLSLSGWGYDVTKDRP